MLVGLAVGGSRMGGVDVGFNVGRKIPKVGVGVDVGFKLGGTKIGGVDVGLNVGMKIPSVRVGVEVGLKVGRRIPSVGVGVAKTGGRKIDHVGVAVGKSCGGRMAPSVGVGLGVGVLVGGKIGVRIPIGGSSGGNGRIPCPGVAKARVAAKASQDVARGRGRPENPKDLVSLPTSMNAIF